MEDGFNVIGRGLKEPRLTIDVLPDVTVLRVDDNANPEFWLEVQLTPRALVELLERFCVLSDGNRVKLLLSLDHFKELLKQ